MKNSTTVFKIYFIQIHHLLVFELYHSLFFLYMYTYLFLNHLRVSWDTLLLNTFLGTKLFVLLTHMKVVKIRKFDIQCSPYSNFISFPRFLNLIIDMMGQQFLMWETSLCSIPNLLGSSRICCLISQHDNQKCHQGLPYFPGVDKILLIEILEVR